MLTQALFDCKRVVREKALYVAVALLALFMAYFMLPTARYDMSVVVDGNVFISGNYSVEQYRQRYFTLLNNLASNTYEGAPEHFLELKQCEEDALGDIMKFDAEKNNKEKFDAMLRYAQVQLEQVKAGYLGGLTLLECEASIERIRQHINTNIYAICENPNEMPALNSLAYHIRNVSTLLLLLPAVIVFSGLLSSGRASRTRQLESLVPLGAAKMLLSHLLVAWLISCMAVLLVFIPAFIAQSTINGVGSLDYPIIDVLEGQIRTNSLGGYLGQYLALVFLVNLFIGTLLLFASRFFDSRAALVIIAFVIGLIPSLPFYFQGSIELRSLLHVLPTTYFNIFPAIGQATTFLTNSLIGNAAITFINGVIVLLLFSLVLVLASLAVSRWRIKVNIFHRKTRMP
jgi:hypothetical protein